MTLQTPPLFGAQQTARTSDDYYTPAWIFESLGVEFDLDVVAAPPGGVPWIPARRYFTKADDGLAQPWTGRVWMNPPYSETSAWARRFLDHANGIALLPHAKSKWHIDLLARADGIATPTTYFAFEGGPIFLPVFFAAMGADNVDAIARLGAVRVLRRTP